MAQRIAAIAVAILSCDFGKKVHALLLESIGNLQRSVEKARVSMYTGFLAKSHERRISLYLSLVRLIESKKAQVTRSDQVEAAAYLNELIKKHGFPRSKAGYEEAGGKISNLLKDLSNEQAVNATTVCGIIDSVKELDDAHQAFEGLIHEKAQAEAPLRVIF